MRSAERAAWRFLALLALIPVVASLQADSMDDDDDVDHGVDRTGVELAFALPPGSDERIPRHSPQAKPLARDVCVRSCLI